VIDAGSSPVRESIGNNMSLLIAILIAAVLIIGPAMWLTKTDIYNCPKKCSKDPTKNCPYTVTWHSGGMTASGHSGCCKFWDKIKALNRLASNADPNKSYGEIRFTKEFIEKEKAAYDEIQAIDTSGPVKLGNQNDS
jgi:hypothetical protein